MGTARNGPTGWSGAKWSQKYGPLAWSVGQVVPEPILQAGQESGGSRNGPAGWSGGQVVPSRNLDYLSALGPVFQTASLWLTLEPQPLLCGGAAWPTSPYTTLWIPGGSHFLGPPSPLLMAHLPRADCTHVCTSPPRRNQGWAWGLQVGCPRTCAQGHPR